MSSSGLSSFVGQLVERSGAESLSKDSETAAIRVIADMWQSKAAPVPLKSVALDEMRELSEGSPICLGELAQRNGG